MSGRGQSAVVERLPMRIETSVPVYLNVRHHGADGIRLALHGRGRA